MLLPFFFRVNAPTFLSWSSASATEVVNALARQSLRRYAADIRGIVSVSKDTGRIVDDRNIAEYTLMAGYNVTIGEDASKRWMWTGVTHLLLKVHHG